jgi:hypothetical protein
MEFDKIKENTIFQVEHVMMEIGLMVYKMDKEL